MPRMLADWEHTTERLLQRVVPDCREAVSRRISLIMEPQPMIAPPEAVGHYGWYIDVGNAKGEVVARIICRGITLRTVYGPLMEGGMPSPKGARYRVNKERQFVKV